jgi:hypothetical protein
MLNEDAVIPCCDWDLCGANLVSLVAVDQITVDSELI